MNGNDDPTSGNEWAAEFKAAVDGATSAIRRLRALASFPPLGDAGSLASAWCELIVDDDIGRFVQGVRRCGDDLLHLGGDAAERAAHALQRAIEERLPSMPAEEVHRFGLVRVDDFCGAVGVVRIPKVDGTMANVAMGAVNVLQSDNPLRTALSESELCSGNQLALGLLGASGFPRSFYNLQHAIELTRIIAERQRQEREDRERHWRERGERIRRADELQDKHIRALRLRHELELLEGGHTG